MSPCDRVRVHLGGYVLAGLDDDERDWVDAHLQACPDCRSELDSLAALPPLLALVEAAPPAPPAGLRERIRREVERRGPSRRVVALTAAALLLGVVMGSVAVPPLLQRARRDSAVTVALRPEEGFSVAGSVTFTDTGEGLRVNLTLEGLPPPEGGGVYEVWLAEWAADEPTSIGLVDPAPGGRATTALAAEGSLADYRSIWVTAEPDALDPGHDGQTVVAAPVPARTTTIE